MQLESGFVEERLREIYSNWRPVLKLQEKEAIRDQYSQTYMQLFKLARDAEQFGSPYEYTSAEVLHKLIGMMQEYLASPNIGDFPLPLVHGFIFIAPKSADMQEGFLQLEEDQNPSL